MTRFLARKPRHHKTRAYLETLPKRSPVIVKPEDYPLSVTRAEARLDAALQHLRDAQRYADWEARGKPPSPSMERRKDRMRPKRGRDNLRAKLYDAQGGLCGICGAHMGHAALGTIDHVMPRALGGKNVGNMLLAHPMCNNIKADRPPTRDEMDMLGHVNQRLAQRIEARSDETPAEAVQPGGREPGPKDAPKASPDNIPQS